MRLDWPRSVLPPELRDDFRNCLYAAWRYLGLPEPTPAQYSIAHYLQHGPDPSRSPFEAPNNRILLEGQRGIGKSWITGVFALWWLGLDPFDHEALVVSAGQDKADEFSFFAQRCLTAVPVFAPLFPRDPKRFSTVAFDVEGHRVSQSPSCRSRGIFGQLTGGRSDLIIFDDIEVPNTAETQVMRAKLRERVGEFQWIIKPGGRQIGLGTPHFEDTIYDYLTRQGFSKRLWPARYPGEEWRSRYGEHLDPQLAREVLEDPGLTGRPTDPRRFNDVDLRERELVSGPSKFALQMMLDTRPSEAEKRPLRVRDLIVAPVDPEAGPERLVYLPGPATLLKDLPNVAPDGDNFYGPAALEGLKVREYEGRAMAIDPSGRGGDEIAWAVGLQMHGYVFVPELVGTAGGYEDANLEAIALCAQRYRVNEVVVEDNFGDGMFSKLLAPWLRKHHPCRLTEVKHHRQKELRIIDTLEPLLNQHRLVVDPRVIRTDYESVQGYKTDVRREYSLVYQLTRITRERGALRHDDRLDALAILGAYWSAAAAQAVEEAVARRGREDVDQEVREFIERCDRRRRGKSGRPYYRTWGGQNSALRSR